MTTECKIDDWDCICEKPHGLDQRLECLRRSRPKSLGFIDSFRVRDSGPAREYPGKITERKREPKTVPLEKSGGGKSKNISPGTKASPWKGSDGSALFTSTTKVHAPSWSVPMGASCPVVRTPVSLLVRQMAEEGRQMSNEEVIATLKTQLPQKCLACYAMTGNYPKKETQDAMARRLNWFNNTGDREVEDTLVKAISVAGDEKCTHKTQKCTYTPEVAPRHFRLFDSGDFQSPRDVKIWRKVAARLPSVKFWMPTTAWAAPCADDVRSQEEHDSLMRELRKANALSNVVVKPSATSIDSSAPNIKGLSQGSAVVEKDFVKKHGGREGKYMTVCGTTPSGKKTDCRRHYVCPGNCGTCKACWKGRTPVVYIRHGLKAEDRNILEIFNRTVGTHTPPTSSTPETYKDANKLLQRQFINWTDIGPWGGKLPKYETRTPEEIAKARAQIQRMKALKKAKKK